MSNEVELSYHSSGIIRHKTINARGMVTNVNSTKRCLCMVRLIGAVSLWIARAYTTLLKEVPH